MSRQLLVAPPPVKPKVSSLRGTEMTTAQWRQLIDETWGPGDAPAEQLRIFDLWWTAVDQKFACFQDLDVDWAAVRDKYRPEVQAGVSRGRFAAIMNHMALQLRESHTLVTDALVNGHLPTPGVPILFCGPWSWIAGFLGASLTPLPDKTLLVYQVASAANNPLGFQPGDVVLGYEGRLWKDIYPALIAAELPLMRSSHTGSEDSAYEHSWLAAAGSNWHLFQTIDIRKRVTGEVVHLSTSLLANRIPEPLLFSEQMAIPGVKRLTADDVFSGKQVSSGIIPGAGIGYVYVCGLWSPTVSSDFAHAVQSARQAPKGMILDIRSNFGGDILLSNDALALLFEGTTATIDFVQRTEGGGHLDLSPLHVSSDYLVNGQAPENAYSRPIAVLVGPGALSGGGDHLALRMSLHPRARIFGKPTAGAFGDFEVLDFGRADWYGQYAVSDTFLVSAAERNLTRQAVRIDEPVWLTPEDVAAGRDTVVEAAIRWINEQNANPRRQFVIPQLTRSSSEDTGIALTNPSSEDQEIELTAYGLNGAPVPFAQNPVHRTMPAKSQLAEFVDEMFSGLTNQAGGWVEVTSKAPVAGLFQITGAGEMDGANGLSVPVKKLVFPRLYSGAAAYRGLEARTRINLVNPSAASCDVNLFLVEKKSGTSSNTIAIRLPGHGVYSGELEEPSALTGELGGAPLALTADVSDYYLVAEVTRGPGVVGFQSINFPSSSTLVGLNALVPSVEQSMYAAQLASVPGIFTSVNLINTASSSRELILSAIDNGGHRLAPAVTLTLAPGAAIERYADELFTFPSGSKPVGTLKVEADGPGVVGDVLFGEPEYLRLAAALPLQATGFRSAIFSQVANGMGMFTGFALYNPAGQAAKIRIEVFSLTGEKTGEASFWLGIGERLSKLVHELAPATAGQIRGYVRLSSSQPIVAQELFGTADVLSAVPPVVLE